MAEVYLAVASGPAGVTKLQVIKRLRRNLAEEPDFLNMFLDEARLATRLNHPNVVQTNEVGQEGQDYFIAMEYLDGQPLNRILNAVKTTPAPPGFVLQIIADALAGLHYAHGLADYDGSPLNIVHRDTSPHNIFVTYDGQTKLVDFGIAKASRRTSETSFGIIKGKFTYMSPEQAACADVDRRSDVFVMGLVLWEALAGQRIWKNVGEMEIVTKLIAGDIPKVTDVRPDTPPELARICERALAHKAADRYATAAEMRRDLLAYLTKEGLQIGPESMSEYLSTVFADRREELKKVLEQQLRVAGDDTGPPSISGVVARVPSMSLADLPDISVTTGPDHTPSRSRKDLETQARPTPLSGAPTVVTAPRLSRQRLAAIGVAAAIVLSLGGYLAFGRHAPPQAALASPAPSATPAPPPTAEPGAPGVELRVHAEPSAAQLFLDDAPLTSNPFTARFKPDGVTHRLRVEAAGYLPHTQLVTFEKDIDLEISLAPAAAASGSSHPKAAVVVVTPTHSPAAATPTAAASTPPAAATAAPTTPKTGRSLDDPWSEGPKPTATSKRTLDSSAPF